MRDGVLRIAGLVAAAASITVACHVGDAMAQGGGARGGEPTPAPERPPGDGAAPREGALPPDLGSLFAGTSACPRPDAVRAELATLLPPERLSARLRAFPGTPAVVEIFDLGVGFRVVVAGRVREYRDEPRDCAHRARVAAVFVALTIDPASVILTTPPPPQPPPAAVTEMLSAAAPAGVRLEVAGAVDAGVGSADRVAHAGAAVRLTVGRGRLAFAGGAIALWPADTSVGGVRVRQWRLPIDAGIRANFAGRGFAPYAELGLCAAIVSEAALDLVSANSQTAVDLGARAALGVRIGASRFAPFAALHAEVIPMPTEIYALPRGVAGHTPYLWIGVSAGASVGFLR